MAVYDCSPFFNENDIYEVHLKEHWDFVDKFISVEARTHLLDVTVSHPRPNRLLEAHKNAATEAGATNNINFTRKTNFYQSRWSLHDRVAVLPCPFETGGRWHEGFKEFFGLMFLKAYREEEYRSTLRCSSKPSQTGNHNRPSTCHRDSAH